MLFCGRTVTFVTVTLLSNFCRLLLVNSSLEYQLNGLTNTQGFTMTAWGNSVSDAGDINGDGVNDIIIGAYWVDGSTGKVAVVFGKKNTVISNLDLTTFITGPTTGFRILAAASGACLGYSVSKAGDVNGDGVDDVIVGAWGVDIGVKADAGISYVVFGRKVTIAASNAFSDIQLTNSAMTVNLGFRILGAAANDHSGGFVSEAGDANGDGIDDVIVGSNMADNLALGPDSNAGIAYVIFGRNMTHSSVAFGDVDLALVTTGSSLGFRILGASIGDRCGFYVSTAGDVNGDKSGDIIVGARYANSGAGIAYVIFGRKVTSPANTFGDIQLPTNTMAAEVGFRILGGAANDYMGNPVSEAGDVNGDGVDDIVVGAFLADPPGLPASSDAGIIYVIFGRDIAGGAAPFGDLIAASFTSGSTIGFRQFGTFASNSGYSVSGAGDVNDDGIDDIIIGALYADPTSSVLNAGISYVIYGRKSKYGAIVFEDIYLSYVNISSNIGFRILGSSTNDHSGFSVSGAGDVNGDTVADLLVGTEFGSSYVIFGTPANPTSQPSSQPSFQPTSQPTKQPSLQPTGQPSSHPSMQPNNKPSCQPSGQPSGQPSLQPSAQPSGVPSQQPFIQPSKQPTSQPSLQPLSLPSGQPSGLPSKFPSAQPTKQPYTYPTAQPSCQPTTQPSVTPSSAPTSKPSYQPSTQPSAEPSRQPQSQPSSKPSSEPSKKPTEQPSAQPSTQPSTQPSMQPSRQPSCLPIVQPTTQPTSVPSIQPSSRPSTQPSTLPSVQPSTHPSVQPLAYPSTQPTELPSSQPSDQPSGQPSSLPSLQPPGIPSGQPSASPTAFPSGQPSAQPLGQPTALPTIQPICMPTAQPSELPSCQPTVQPTFQPSCQPSAQPTQQPLVAPSCQPTAHPTSQPTTKPSMRAVALTGLVNTRSVTVVDRTLWVCGADATVSCMVVEAGSGAIANAYALPGTHTNNIIASDTTDTVYLSGKSYSEQGVVSGDIARCTIEVTQQLSCTARLFPEVEFLVMAFVPYPMKVVFLGKQASHVLLVIADDLTSSTELTIISSYAYSFKSIYSVTITHALSPPVYVGSFVVGTCVGTNQQLNYIVVGAARTDSGTMTAMYLAPSSGTIRNSVGLVNAMTLEYEHPDTFIAGGLELSDGMGLHSYLLRVNAFFGSVKYCVLYRTSQEQNRRRVEEAQTLHSVTKGMVRLGSSLYMIVDMMNDNNNSCHSLTVLNVAIGTGLIQHQVHVSSTSACMSCTAIAASSDGLILYIACNVQYNTSHAEAILIATDVQLSFRRLPIGFTRSEENLFAEELVPFKRYSLPVTNQPADLEHTEYSFTTSNQAVTRSPTVTPTIQPSTKPSSAPSGQPSSSPTAAPSVSPQPTSHPSSSGPTNTYKPTPGQSRSPSRVPSNAPTTPPTEMQSLLPTLSPSAKPSSIPTMSPSLARTVAPSPSPTVKVTRNPSVLRSSLPTPAPTSPVSISVVGATISPNPSRADDTVMIFVYIVAGVTGLWCCYQLWKCLVQVKHNAKRKQLLQVEMKRVRNVIQLENIQRATIHDSTPAIQVPRQIGAFANGEPIIPNAVGSDASSSVLLSSLHSSEMSDISFSMYSGEESYNSNGTYSEPTNSKESLVEEGGNAVGYLAERDFHNSYSASEDSRIDFSCNSNSYLGPEGSSNGSILEGTLSGGLN